MSIRVPVGRLVERDFLLQRAWWPGNLGGTPRSPESCSQPQGSHTKSRGRLTTFDFRGGGNILRPTSYLPFSINTGSQHGLQGTGAPPGKVPASSGCQVAFRGAECKTAPLSNDVSDDDGWK